MPLGYLSSRKFSKNVPIEKDSSKTGDLSHRQYRPREDDMACENTPTEFAERVRKGLLHQDCGNTSRDWHALLQQTRHKEHLRIAREIHRTWLRELFQGLLQGFLSASTMQL